MGAILMKMADFFKGNASHMEHFQTVLDLEAISNLKIDHWSHLLKGNEGYGGDLDENG